MVIPTDDQKQTNAHETMMISVMDSSENIIFIQTDLYIKDVERNLLA